MNLLPVLTPLVILGVILYLYMRQKRERTTNAPLRGEIQARVCFATKLDRVSILGTGGFGGTRGQWFRLIGPKRLVVGADAFMISLPQALREFVFTGRESSIQYSQAPSRLIQRDWIIITGQASGRPVQVAITKDGGMPEIWQALAGTGAADGTGQLTRLGTAAPVSALPVPTSACSSSTPSDGLSVASSARSGVRFVKMAADAR